MTTALEKSWRDQGYEAESTPTKSSLSEFRSKVSYEFFKEVYESDLDRLNTSRKTFRGFYIYAVDGDDFNLPYSEKILEGGYRGRLYAKGFETYYPKMYTVSAYDVMNGLVSQFGYSTIGNEYSSSLRLIQGYEKNSIAIYDRNYGSYPIMNEHLKHGSHFLIRLRSCGRTFLPVRGFLESKKKSAEVFWPSSTDRKCAPIKVRLLRFKNPKSKEVMVFATSLPRELFGHDAIEALYQKRWEVETAFRDLTTTMKAEQWHSKSENGILQEIYALLWFINNVKIQLSRTVDKATWLDRHYKKANFKLCARIVVDHLHLLWTGKCLEMEKLLRYWIDRTQERRRRLSRSYPREIKFRPTNYAVRSKVPRRKAP